MLIALLTAACAPSASPSPAAKPTEAPKAEPAAPAAAPAAPAAKPAESKPAEAAKPAAPPAVPVAAQSVAESLDALYEKAKAEGGTITFYGTIAQANAEKLWPIWEKRFPGIKIEHVDATADKLVARVVAEARGGKVLADVFSTSLEYVLQVERQGLLLPALPPEAQAYPDNLKGTTWVAADLQFIVAAWNTSLVRPEETPTQFEDFADPRWRGRLIAEPRDVELLIALVQKLGSEERAADVLRRMAANDVEFHRGHSELAELLASGHAAACVTCYSHHYPSRIRRGAPLDYLLTEGIGMAVGTAALKDAPRPYTAMLWQRWTASEEGQQAYAEGGRTPAHPNVQPREKTRPERIYPLGVDDIPNWNRYERTWKEIFQLR